MHHRNAIFAASVILAAGTTAAQVVTPPPGPRPAFPEYIPPAPPEPTFDSFDGLDPNLYQNVEYESIVKRDDDGNLVIYDTPDLEALLAAPVVPDEVWPIIEVVLQERRERMIRHVASNVAGAIEIQLGIVDTLNMDDPTTIQNIIQYTQPISPREPILAELARSGAVDSPTQRLAGRIYGEYQSAHFQRIDAEYASGERQKYADVNSAKAAFLLNEGIRESMAIFEELALTIANNPEGVFAEAGVEAPDADFASGSETERINAVARALTGLDEGSQIIVMQAAAQRLIMGG